MSNITGEVVYEPTLTRACLITPEGEYVCSRMAMHLDGVTLLPVGKTRDKDKAQAWLDTGIFTGTEYE